MRTVFLLLFFSLVIVGYSNAQNGKKSILSDTIYLEEIVKYGDYSKYQSGAKIESINALQMSVMQNGGVEQLLMRLTPIYIKSNAGGLSSIHVRGTAASHTNVMFGGLAINSLTLGDTNLSNYSSFLFDEIKIQYGSSATMNGSGAIGGAIYLDEKHYWTDGMQLVAKYSLGSFGERSYGGKLFFGNGKWESATKIMKYSTDNNFPFMNIATGNVELRDGVKDVQRGAAINNLGIIQQFNYLFGSKEYFKSSFWYENSWREVQLNMQENYGNTVPEVIEDNNFRFWSEYKNENRSLNYGIGVGYVHDKEVYNSDISQKIQTDRAVVDLNLKQNLFEKFEYKAGARFTHIVPDVYSYPDSVVDYEQHLELYLSTFYQPIKKMRISVNFRQQFVTNFDVPFTPSAGAEYSIFKNKKQQLLAKMNASRLYRVPTMNDRYWGNQGNTNLKPEDGVSFDAGLQYRWNNDAGAAINAQLNLFYIDVENWIEWRNKGIWVPVNLGNVISKGVEFHADSKLEIGKTTSNILVNYTFNPARKIEEGKPTQQLIYIPEHMANASYILQYGAAKAFVDGCFTGSRFNNYAASEYSTRDELKAYFLANCGVSYCLLVKQQQLDCSFSVNNLFDANYQNQKYYAMPGISFRFGIVATINADRNKTKIRKESL